MLRRHKMPLWRLLVFLFLLSWLELEMVWLTSSATFFIPFSLPLPLLCSYLPSLTHPLPPSSTSPSHYFLGPWDVMEEFDDGIPERRFDNFQFVNFYKVLSRAENREVDFAVAALMEIPEQFQLIRKLGLL